MPTPALPDYVSHDRWLLESHPATLSIIGGVHVGVEDRLVLTNATSCAALPTKEELLALAPSATGQETVLNENAVYYEVSLTMTADDKLIGTIDALPVRSLYTACYVHNLHERFDGISSLTVKEVHLATGMDGFFTYVQVIGSTCDSRSFIDQANMNYEGDGCTTAGVDDVCTVRSDYGYWFESKAGSNHAESLSIECVLNETSGEVQWTPFLDRLKPKTCCSSSPTYDAMVDVTDCPAVLRHGDTCGKCVAVDQGSPNVLVTPTSCQNGWLVSKATCEPVSDAVEQENQLVSSVAPALEMNICSTADKATQVVNAILTNIQTQVNADESKAELRVILRSTNKLQ